MSPNQTLSNPDTEAINRGFSKQSDRYDEADESNIILQDLRRQVYNHIETYLKPSSHILELNAGTGIDAVYFVKKGHRVHATDLSDGMINQIRQKILLHKLSDNLTCQQMSYENLDQVSTNKFDHIFSNFGGLNCIQDLSKVTRHLKKVLKPGGYVTWVIMPPICPWELVWLLKGNYKQAFRRFSAKGVLARVEGEYFRTYYHSLGRISGALGHSFHLVRAEGLASLSPQPHSRIPTRFPHLYRRLRVLDAMFKDSFPFNRWADHIIVTFRNSGQH